MSDPADAPRLIALLRLASEAGQQALYRRLAADGHTDLRPSHFRLLRFPGPDGVRPSALADRLGMSKQALNPLINDLERWGYLSREPDPEDGRARVLRLSPRGRALLRRIRHLHADIEQEWRQRLGETTFDAVTAALRDMSGTGEAPTEVPGWPA